METAELMETVPEHDKVRLFLASSLAETADSIAEHLAANDLKNGLFVTTASEVEEGAKPFIEKDRNKLIAAGFTLTDFSFTGKNPDEVCAAVAQASAVIVEGGNTFFLLQQLRSSGADKVVAEAVRQGKPYLGSSAGSLIAGDHIELAKRFDDAKIAPDLKSFEGMRLVDLTIDCHWGNTAIPDNKKKNLEELAELFDREERFIFLRDTQFLRVVGNCYRIESTKS